MMKKHLKWSSVLVFCVIGIFLTGCASGTKIVTTQEKYAPSFRAGDYSRYKGKKLVLSNFYNQAQNTKTYNYFSPDKKLNYEFNVSLESFYMNSFQKAFRHIGVNLVDYVYDDKYRGPGAYHPGYWWGVPGPAGYRAPKGVAEFQFILLSLTDQELKFKAVLFREGETKFDKDFTVTMAPAATDNTAELERRAYKLVDLAFTTIMKDSGFQKAF